MPIIIADTPAEMLEALKALEPEAPIPHEPISHTPILLNEELIQDKPGLYGALCPGCKNVDIKFQARNFQAKSSFKILVEYAGSGVDLQCLCCNTSFKFCGNKGMFGNYKLKNHVWVTQEWAIANLGIGE